MMKKVIAVLIALLMVFTLFACGGAGGDTKPSGGGDAQPSGGGDAQPSGGGDAQPSGGDAEPSGGDAEPSGGDAEPAAAATPNMNADGSINLDKVAHYDPTYDYSQNPRFKMCYCAFSADVGYQQTADAYEAWCDAFNLEWSGFVSANNDSETFLTQLQLYLDQGIDIFVMDPDITIFPRIVEILKDYPDAQWMSMLGPARDWIPNEYRQSGELLHPFCGFDYKDGGALCAENLVEWKEATYPDVPWSEFGFAAFTLSTSPPLAERETGVREVWTGLEGVKEEQYFAIDVASLGLTMQAGMDGLAPIIAANSQYKYWLVYGLIDDLAIGAANVLENANLTATSCVNCAGGPGLQTQLDAGQHTAYRYCYSLPSMLYAEPVLGACYAWKMGWATPDTLWPSWVKATDHGGEGHSYGFMLLPSYFIDESNYKQFYAWTDMYTGTDYYGYSKEGVSIDDWSPFMDVPEGYRDS